VNVRTVETVREGDGLAMSSRNRYLSSEQRVAAGVLSRALDGARRAVADGETSATRVRQILAETIRSEELADLDYADVADAVTLAPLDRLAPNRSAIALVAARFGSTRLIDNTTLIR
jgi:pantoate--beta-alanine ligase